MFKIVIPEDEFYNESTNEFVQVKSQELHLVHSLVSVSKWESIWQKSFLTNKNPSRDESISYIRCMTVNQNVDSSAYSRLTNELISRIVGYIDAPMTATVFYDEKKKSNAIITSEIIYGWMVALTIPFECQKWHLNRLLTLIKVCDLQNQPKKKIGQREILARNAALNEARKAKLNTTG